MHHKSPLAILGALALVAACATLIPDPYSHPEYSEKRDSLPGMARWVIEEKENTPIPKIEIADPASYYSLVKVDPHVIDGFDFLYKFVSETEFVLCLEGRTMDDGTIHIDGSSLAKMEATSYNSVRYQPCDTPHYIGTAHNHPPTDDPETDLCYQSEPDRRSFNMDPRAIIDIVICGDHRYKWFRKDGKSATVTLVSPPQ